MSGNKRHAVVVTHPCTHHDRRRGQPLLPRLELQRRDVRGATPASSLTVVSPGSLPPITCQLSANPGDRMLRVFPIQSMVSHRHRVPSTNCGVQKRDTNTTAVPGQGTAPRPSQVCRRKNSVAAVSRPLPSIIAFRAASSAFTLETKKSLFEQLSPSVRSCSSQPREEQKRKMDVYG